MRRIDIQATCVGCGTQFDTKPWRIRAGRRYCSLDCPGHPRHGNRFAFRGERRKRGALYYEARQMFPLDRPCEMCGGEPELIHHIDENPANNVESNVQRLCRPCHVRHHQATR